MKPQAAVVRGCPPGPGEILSNVVVGQAAEHRPYGGVVPEIAAPCPCRDHRRRRRTRARRGEHSPFATSMRSERRRAGADRRPHGGLVTAKALALGAGKPLVAVNHLEAHALSARLSQGTEFPFLLLLISGGHCQLMAAEDIGRYRLYGATNR